MNFEHGTVEVVDVHVGGDLHRIVVDGIGDLPGASLMEKMAYLKSRADGLRQLLLTEPRGGHPSLYADLVVDPVHPDADAGFIIMELMGYPLISGTNTISTAIALLQTGRLPMAEGLNTLALEAPGGLIQVQAECAGGKVRSVTYQATTPSFVAGTNLRVDVPGKGTITFDLIWTGAFYPVMDAASLGFSLERNEEQALVQFSREFVEAVRREHHPLHPIFGDEGPLSFAILAGPARPGSADILERRICCFEYPRNSVCRSPAGVPTTAALLQLAHRGELQIGETLRTVSIFGSDLQATLTDTLDYHGHPGFLASIKGSGWIVARSQLIVDFDDPMTPHDGLGAILPMRGMAMGRAAFGAS